MSKFSGYPLGCQSAQCGQILCDGCRDKPVLIAWYKQAGAGRLAAYNINQAKLRADKAAKSGAFAFLQEAAS